jgi:hypothetical protein
LKKAMNLSSDEAEGGKRDPVKVLAGPSGNSKTSSLPKGARSQAENWTAEGSRTGAPINVAGLAMATKIHLNIKAV